MEVSLQELQSWQLSLTSADRSHAEGAGVRRIIDLLNMETHIEGGYFVETDRDARQITLEGGKYQPAQYSHNTGEQRPLSTSIFYLLTPKRSIGHFHRNASRTIHNLHQGRGIYVILKNDNDHGSNNFQIETFRVGRDIAGGERLQWIVEGGNYKASFLIPDASVEEGESSLLISEVMSPASRLELGTVDLFVD